MEIKLSLSLPRDEISIPIVRRICTQALKVLGVSQECIDDVELALTEACANVLLHAMADDEYEVSVGVDNQVAAIEVVDHGGGFDALAAFDDGGIPVRADVDVAFHNGAGPNEISPVETNQDGANPNGVVSRSDPWAARANHERPGQGQPNPDQPYSDQQWLEQVPTDAVPEQGRGIFLMRALMDHVQFHTVDGPHPGTRVHLEKLLTWDESAPGAKLGRVRSSRGPWSGQRRDPAPDGA
ncbi:ATP-binding protein [Parafrankia discariae]|uniref:ATP-binding protein n=1 Tax=Parafrankia discariae TaxID=365528 RepID=UPI00036FCC40|nr:ATP-binding protein [Parafrankia discariae]